MYVLAVRGQSSRCAQKLQSTSAQQRFTLWTEGHLEQRRRSLLTKTRRHTAGVSASWIKSCYVVLHSAPAPRLPGHVPHLKNNREKRGTDDCGHLESALYLFRKVVFLLWAHKRRQKSKPHTELAWRFVRSRATCCQWFVNRFFGKRAAHTDPCILWSTMDANFQCLRCRAFPAVMWCDTQTLPCSCSVLCTDSTRSAHAISSLPCLRPASFSAMASTPAKRISSSSWICGRPHSYHNVSCVICTLILQVARESTPQTCATQSSTQARVGYRKRGEKQRTKACATCFACRELERY